MGEKKRKEREKKKERSDDRLFRAEHIPESAGGAADTVDITGPFPPSRI